MIHYSPVDVDPRRGPIRWRPKTAFIMQQLGTPIPRLVKSTRKQVETGLTRAGFSVVDAKTLTTGHDYLLKIWDLLLGCPVGIAIVHEGISPSTMANIYYELGMLQAYGRDTVVVKVGDVALPSDFSRTEHIVAGKGFAERFKRFADSLKERREYYLTVSDGVENNPLLAIDYLRRAALLGGKSDLNRKARAILLASGIGDRAKSSVEELMLKFLTTCPRCVDRPNPASPATTPAPTQSPTADAGALRWRRWCLHWRA